MAKLKVQSITRIALLGALLYASHLALAFLPNVEIVTLLVVLFTKHFGKEGTLSCFVYVLLTAFTWGFGLWWATYLVVWAGYSLLVNKLRKIDSWLVWALINAAFGLCFGAIFAVPYIFVSPAYALSYWISGIPFDLVHCAGNFAMAIILGKPLDLALGKIKHISENVPQKRLK